MRRVIRQRMEPNCVAAQSVVRETVMFGLCRDPAFTSSLITAPDVVHPLGAFTTGATSNKVIFSGRLHQISGSLLVLWHCCINLDLRANAVSSRWIALS
jgi:hypothetical protein